MNQHTGSFLLFLLLVTTVMESEAFWNKRFRYIAKGKVAPNPPPVLKGELLKAISKGRRKRDVIFNEMTDPSDVCCDVVSLLDVKQPTDVEVAVRALQYVDNREDVYEACVEWKEEQDAMGIEDYCGHTEV